MSPKEFLIHELGHVERTLQETLRHDFPPGSTRDFYNECKTRLSTLRGLANAVAPTNSALISAYCEGLSKVSFLISLIERSHLGEFSWPFAQRLREIATPLCTEPGPKGDLTPIIHILADGGLTAYRIFPESYLADGLRHRRILNIVFPRTLKHHVLLHVIFGHEIGHAAWAIPARRSELERDVIAPLFAKTPLETEATAEAWITGARPAAVDVYLDKWNLRHQHQFSFTGKNNHSLYLWKQELFCDLVGTLVFGPSFACAHNTLLGTGNPTGEAFSTTHPPYGIRAPLVAKILARLNWLKFAASGNPALDKALGLAEMFATTIPAAEAWYDIFPTANIDQAVAGLQGILARFQGAPYSPPTIATLADIVDKLLRRVPPCGAALPASGVPDLSVEDFRYVLYGGWVLWLGRTELPAEKALGFFEVNQLCDRGILQQIAVERARSS